MLKKFRVILLASAGVMALGARCGGEYNGNNTGASGQRGNATSGTAPSGTSSSDQEQGTTNGSTAPSNTPSGTSDSGTPGSSGTSNP